MAPSGETKAGNPPPLPPSVENAYRKKCIALKRRLIEVEESNDAARIRKVRLERGIRKMRLERAFLLDQLAKRMKKNPHILGENGLEEDESEDSSEGPPTPPNEGGIRPFRRRNYRPRPAEEQQQQQQQQQAIPMNGASEQTHTTPSNEHYAPGQPQSSFVEYAPPPTDQIPPQSDQIPQTLISPVTLFYFEEIVNQSDRRFASREEEELFMMDEWNQLTDEQRVRWERRLQEKRHQLGLPPYTIPVPIRIAQNPRNAYAPGDSIPEAGSAAGAGGGFTAVNS